MSNDLIALQKEIDEITSLRSEAASIMKAQEIFQDTIFLLDFSGSMDEYLENKPKIEHLKNALKKLHIDPKNCVSFESFVQDGIMSETGGSTRLHAAFEHIKGRKFNKIMVISDGQPDSPEMALQKAKELGKPVNILFIGKDGNYGEEFMKELASVTKGNTLSLSQNIQELLSQKITYLLTN